MIRKHINILIILTFFTILWAFYNYVIRPKDLSKKHFMGGCVIDIPEKIQPLCPIINYENEVGPEKCLDKWSVGHIVIYFVLGLCQPGEYKLVLGTSVACEIFENMIKHRARMSDIYVNMFGYIIGSYLNQYYKINLKGCQKHVKPCILILIVSGLCLIASRKQSLARIKNIPQKDHLNV